MPDESTTIRVGDAIGWLKVSSEDKKKPRKRPIWQLRYSSPQKRSDQTIGYPWIDMELWTATREVRHMRSRPAEGFMTASQAQDAAKAYLQTLTRAAPQERHTLQEACEAFLAEKRRSGVTPQTLYCYQSYGNVLCGQRWKRTDETWGERALSAITPQDVTNLRNRLADEGKATSTLNHFAHMIRGAFGEDSDHAKAWLWGTDRKNQSGKIQFYTIEQLAVLFEHCVSDEERAIYAVSAMLGTRRSEILALKRKDIMLDNSSARLEDGYTRHGGIGNTKTHQMRSLGMAAQLIEILRPFVEGLPAYDSEGEPLLLFSRDPQGRFPLDPDSVSKRFQRTRARAGLPRIKFHDLRHTFATVMMASGQIDIRSLMEMLGHSKIETTQRYLHYAPKHDQALVATGAFSGVLPAASSEAEVIPLHRAS